MLHVAQHRLREKTFLRGRGFPVAPFAVVRSVEDLATGARPHRLPGRAQDRAIRLRRQGPGAHRRPPTRSPKPGQASRRRRGDAREASSPSSARCRSSSPRAASTAQLADYRPVENAPRSPHPRRLRRCRRGADAVTAREAVRDRAAPSLEALDVVGVLCVEFFVDRHGELLVNELAPRPHNSRPPDHRRLRRRASSSSSCARSAACRSATRRCTAAGGDGQPARRPVVEDGREASRTGGAARPCPAFSSTSTARPKPARAGRWGHLTASPTTPPCHRRRRRRARRGRSRPQRLTRPAPSCRARSRWRCPSPNRTGPVASRRDDARHPQRARRPLRQRRDGRALVARAQDRARAAAVARRAASPGRTSASTSPTARSRPTRRSSTRSTSPRSPPASGSPATT